MIPLPHDITEQDNGKYECRICEQTWSRKPAAKCPGLKVYPRANYDPLLTKGQLGYHGYKTSKKCLPAPVGCYHLEALESYVMLYNPAQATKKPRRSHPLLPHDLIKHSSSYFECLVCFESWQSRPQSLCPGLRVYDRHDYAPLLNERELEHLGYQTSIEVLPAEVGCYYHQSASRYMYLYDPIQATPKTSSRSGRSATKEILWPISFLFLLQGMSEMHRKDCFSRTESERFWRLHNEIINVAALTVTFTRNEIEHMAGDVIAFRIPPTRLSRFYLDNRVNRAHEVKLRSNLLIAYRRHMSLSQGLS